MGCALFVGRDMHSPQSDRAIADDGVPVLQRATTITEGFHLRAGECDTRLEDFFDRVLMAGFSIGGHNIRHGELRLAQCQKARKLRGGLRSAVTLDRMAA